MKVFEYETMTTFWDDFTIADMFGEAAIKNTYKRVFKEWKSNYQYLTELVMVLNWKLWHHHEMGNERISRAYYELWDQADRYAQENLKGEELQYFYRVTD